MKEKNPNGKKRRPDIGVGVLIVNQDGHILLSRRLKPYGYGKLALPGGHVEWMETLIQTAKREVLEETGIRLKKVEEMRDYTEELNRKMDKHYATFYLIAAMPKNQKPQDMEPHKHGPWGWYDPFKLPKHAWNPTKRLVKRSAHLISAFINRMKYPGKKIAPEGLWKVFFLSRAENGMPASKHFKVRASSAASAFSHAILFTEKHYNVNLVEIEDASARVATQEQWDTEDGYEKI